jgi:taurine dioxygenase
LAAATTFLCRYSWKPGSLAMWDNRATMHYAVNDYGRARRLVHRVTLRGEIPYGPARAVRDQFASTP